MGKRIMLVVVGAAVGSMVGLIVSAFGAGSYALIVGGVLGATIPMLFLGSPGK